MLKFNRFYRSTVLNFVAHTDGELNALKECCSKSKSIYNVTIMDKHPSGYQIAITCRKRSASWLTWFIECSMALAA